MPSIYISKRETTISFLREVIIPNIKLKKDVDYQKLLDFLVLEKGCAPKTAKECVDLFIRNGSIKREGEVLTIPDKEVKNWLDSKVKEEKEIDKIFKND